MLNKLNQSGIDEITEKALTYILFNNTINLKGSTSKVYKLDFNVLEQNRYIM
jgi:hypothetical protein